jgi:hypothetical protein
MGKDCVPAVNIASWTIGPKIAAHVIVEAVWPTLRVSTTGNRWEKRKEHSASDRVSWSCAHGSNLLGRVTYIQLLLCFFFSHGQSMIFDEFLVSRLPGLTKWEMGLGRPRVQTPHAPPMSWILSYLVCHSMSSGFYLSFHIVSCPGLSWTLCIDSSSCVYFRRLYPANTMVTMVAVHSNCLSRSQQISADLSRSQQLAFRIIFKPTAWTASEEETKREVWPQIARTSVPFCAILRLLMSI